LNTSIKHLSREIKASARDEISADWWLPMRQAPL
jgi:hypothetical protein